MTRVHDFVDFGNCHSSGHSHYWVPIALRARVDKVAQRISDSGAQQCEISLERGLEYMVTAVDLADLEVFGESSSTAYGREDTSDPGSTGPDSLG